MILLLPKSSFLFVSSSATPLWTRRVSVLSDLRAADRFCSFPFTSSVLVDRFAMMLLLLLHPLSTIVLFLPRFLVDFGSWSSIVTCASAETPYEL